ncbi:MAG: ytlA, partial [Herbinix sp.]|nr:ytlA [Herbinix sp.]
MKKKLICVLAVIALFTTMLVGCKSDEGLKEITLNEVAHSIFYAPMYVAFEEGYFEDEGLKVNLVNGLGADKTMTAVLAGDCQIGFMGAEASIYVYNEGAEDYVVNFAQLTQRAGNFLVSRDTNETFSWDNIKGKTVIGGRPGG